MFFQPASNLSVVTFCLIVLAVFLFLVGGVYLGAKKNGESGERLAVLTFFLILIFGAGLTLLSRSGLLLAKPVPGFPIFFGLVFLGAVTFAFSKLGNQLMTLSASSLVLFQSFRLPLEIVLHTWAREGTIPETMSWNGQNWDIITGIVSLLLGLFADRSYKITWVANIVGSVLLLNVIRVAVMSSPLPFAWDLDRPLLLAAHFPYLLIGPICVGGALAVHIILTRKLMKVFEIPIA